MYNDTELLANLQEVVFVGSEHGCVKFLISVPAQPAHARSRSQIWRFVFVLTLQFV